MSKARQLAQKPTQPTGRKNLIINGAMTVAQRGEATGVGSGQTYGECDRFLFYGDNTPTFRVTLKQVEDGTDSETTPDGFPNALKVDVTTAQSSITSGQSARIIHKIEAQNLTHLQYGTSSAKTITMSFWVKSSTTGTYTFNFYAEDNARNVGAIYTINAANTWEYKTLTFVGDTVDGINNDNGTGFWCQWFLASGSSQQSGTFATSWQDYTQADYVKTGQPNVMSSTSNDWYITGVQLEVGSVATEFEHRSYGEELALCQRYYQKWYSSVGRTASSTGAPMHACKHSQPMRTTPTINRAANALTGNETGTTVVSLDSERFYHYNNSNIATGGNGTAEAEL